MERIKDLKEFYKEYKIRPHNKEIYEMAFTHSSYNSDAKTHHHDYERLEFMGDSVLGFVVASLLFKCHPEMREGDLTKAKATLVQSKALANYARQLGYPSYVRAGHSLTIEEASKNQSILEDIFEAVIGAIYFDQGIKFVSSFIENVFLKDVQEFKMEEVKDYKSMLQELVQCEHREGVAYKTYDEKGPPHSRTFYVQVSFNGAVLGKGVGKSKKEAEQSAAHDALNKRATL
jgi:ribonuclease III